MKDRKPTKVLQNGAVQYSVTRVSMGVTATREEWIRPEDEPLEAGTPLTAENFLTVQTAAEIWRAGDAPTDPMVNEALAKLAEPNYHVGDILTTVRVLSAPWHACNGSTFSRTAYPALYAVLGGTTLPSISYSSDTTTYIKMADD